MASMEIRSQYTSTTYTRKYVNNDDDNVAVVYVYILVKNMYTPTYS